MIKGRDTTLDYLRGFAIMSIVMGHLYFFSHRAEGSVVWNICNSIQIPIFIFVSGLLANKSVKKYSFQEFTRKRVSRLIIPFFSAFIIWLLIHGINSSNIFTFITDEFKQGFWFFLVLFELTFIFALCILLSERLHIGRFTLEISLFLIINAYHFLVKDFTLVNQILSLNLLWHYYPIYILGIYSRHLKMLFQIKLSILYLLIYCFAFYSLFIKNIHVMLAVCNISSLFFLFTIFKHNYKVAEPAFNKAGRFSLEIYLLHIIVFGVIGDYIPVIMNRGVEAVAYFILAGIICYLFIIISVILKKSKFINFILFGG